MVKYIYVNIQKIIIFPNEVKNRLSISRLFDWSDTYVKQRIDAND
jgi:hypothetical protein